MAILILLGAGASYGSEPNSEALTPPLGVNLFSTLESLGGEAAKIPDDIKQVFKKDFEEGMALYYKLHPGRLQAFHRELCRFLSVFSPSDSNLYVDLLRRFGKRNIIFSSLNYDMMLEDAAIKAGLNFHYNSSKITGSVRVIKPHGSLNFWPDIPASAFKNVTFEMAGNSSALSSPVQPVSKKDAQKRCLEDDSLSPSISMYAKGKAVSICPDFIESQQRMFSQACKKASKIITLGVKVVSEDSHIWKPISRSGGELIYFGNKEDKEALYAWKHMCRKKSITFVNGYFERCLSFMKEGV